MSRFRRQPRCSPRRFICWDRRASGSDRLREFVERGGLSVRFLERLSLTRAFELMELYANHPMDLADASLVAAAESMGTRKIFTVDRKDFETYRIRRGNRHYPMEIVS